MLGVLTSPYAIGVASRFLVQIVAFVQVMIASRYLGLAEFGIYALAWAATVIANSFVYTGFYQALLRSPDIGRDRDTLFWAILAVGLAGGAVIGGIGFGIYWNFGAFTGSVSATTALALCLLAPIPILRAPAAWNESQLIQEQRVRSASSHVVASELCAALVGWLCLRAGYGVLSLIAARYAAVAVELTITTLLIRRVPKLRVDRMTLAQARKTAVPLWGTTAMGMFSNYGADLILGVFLNPAAVGAYRGGARISQTVSDLVLQPLTMLSWSSFTQLEKQGAQQGMRDVWVQNMGFGAVLLWPILACVALLAPELVSVVFDETWLPAAPIVAILCLARAIRFLSVLLEPALICNHQGQRQLRIRFIGAVLLLACLLGFGRYSGAAAAYAHVATSVVVAALSLIAMMGLLQITMRDLARALLPAGAIGGVCVAVVFTSQGWRDAGDPGFGLALTVAALVAVWLVLVGLALRARLLNLPRP